MMTSSFPRYEGDYFGPWILDYCRELVSQGDRVVVLAPAVTTHDLNLLSKEDLIVRRFNYWPLRKSQKLVHPPGTIPQLKSNPLRLFQVPFLLWSYYRSALKVCREYEVDIIHCQWVIPAGFIGALIKKKLKIPLVITSQGAELFLPSKHPFSRFTKWTIQNTDYLLPVSNQMAERASVFGANKKQVLVVPNAVDTIKFSPNLKENFRKTLGLPKKATVILTVRRLVKEKRVEDVIDAFSGISNGKDTYLVIAGDGPELDHLKERVERLNLLDKVIFCGYVDNSDLPEIYSECDIYILSSQQEGLSLSMLEAMSSSLIVVSTESTGGEELIIHEVNGYLYKVAEISKLELCLKNILDLSEKKKLEIGDLARETIKAKYSIPNMVQKWNKVYSKCIEGTKNKL